MDSCVLRLADYCQRVVVVPEWECFPLGEGIGSVWARNADGFACGGLQRTRGGFVMGTWCACYGLGDGLVVAGIFGSVETGMGG